MVQAGLIDGSPTRPDAVPLTEARADPDVTLGAHALFQQPWWLDAVAPGAWDAAVVTKDGQMVGRLPYVRIAAFRSDDPGAAAADPVSRAMDQARHRQDSILGWSASTRS